MTFNKIKLNKRLIAALQRGEKKDNTGVSTTNIYKNFIRKISLNVRRNREVFPKFPPKCNV